MNSPMIQSVILRVVEENSFANSLAISPLLFLLLETVTFTLGLRSSHAVNETFPFYFVARQMLLAICYTCRLDQ